MKKITKAQRNSFTQFFLISSISGSLFAIAAIMDSGMELANIILVLGAILLISIPLAWIATRFDPTVQAELRIQRLNEEWAASIH